MDNTNEEKIIDTAGNPPGTPITSTNLAPTNKTNLPDANIPDNSALSSSVNNVVAQGKTDSAADVAKKALLAKNTADTTKIGTLMKDLGMEDALTSKYADEAGANDALKQHDDYTSQIEFEQKAIRDRIKNFRETFTGTTAGASNMIDKMERDSLSKQADLAIAQSGAARRYSTAMSIAKDKVQIELAPKKAELAGLQYIYDNNKAFQTAEFSSILNRKEKEIDKEEKEKETIASYLVNAMKNNAPAAVRMALSKAKTLEEANQIQGVHNYTSSPEDKLALEIKRLEKTKLSKEIDAMGTESKAPKKETINGVDMFWDATSGTYKPYTELVLFDPKKAKESLTQYGFVTDAVKSATGLSDAAGRGTARQAVGSFLWGATKSKQLESYTDTIKTNLLTMSVDPAIKKFFGPQMTNRDVELMTAGGTTLNPDKQTPEQFQAELNRINSFIVRAKTAVEEGLADYEVESYIDSSGQALEATNNPITNSGLRLK